MTAKIDAVFGRQIVGPNSKMVIREKLFVWSFIDNITI